MKSKSKKTTERTKLPSGGPVEVVWRDAQGGGGWQDFDEARAKAKEPNAFIANGIGYLVDDADDHLILAALKGGTDDESRGAGFLWVPRESIVTVRLLGVIGD